MFSFEFRAVTDRTVGIGLFSPMVLCWFNEINILILKYWIGEQEIGLLGGSEGRNYCFIFIQ